MAVARARGDARSPGRPSPPPPRGVRDGPPGACHRARRAGDRLRAGRAPGGPPGAAPGRRLRSAACPASWRWGPRPAASRRRSAQQDRLHPLGHRPGGGRARGGGERAGRGRGRGSAPIPLVRGGRRGPLVPPRGRQDGAGRGPASSFRRPIDAGTWLRAGMGGSGRVRGGLCPGQQNARRHRSSRAAAAPGRRRPHRAGPRRAPPGRPSIGRRPPGSREPRGLTLHFAQVVTACPCKRG